MDREQEEDVLHITAQYMAELQAGHQPRLSDYLVRYPQYADAISEFVTYYHVVEAGLPEESLGESHVGTLPQLSDSSRTALEHAWERISPLEAAQTDLNTTLFMTINKQGLSPSQLATEIGLSEDIVAKLIAVRPLIEAATLPQEVLRRLARILHQPLSAMQTYSSQLRAAEARAPYHAEAQTQSFREALEQSAQLSDEQKAHWRAILVREGL